MASIFCLDCLIGAWDSGIDRATVRWVLLGTKIRESNPPIPPVKNWHVYSHSQSANGRRLIQKIVCLFLQRTPSPEYYDSAMDVLKGHGNELNFPRLLHKSVWHRSLTLHFEPFRFWLRILGDILIRKTTTRLSDSTIRGVDNSPHHWYTESTTPRITDTESRLINFLKRKIQV